MHTFILVSALSRKELCGEGAKTLENGSYIVKGSSYLGKLVKKNWSLETNTVSHILRGAEQQGTRSLGLRQSRNRCISPRLCMFTGKKSKQLGLTV